MSTGIGSGIVDETEGVMMQQKEMIVQVLGCESKTTPYLTDHYREY